MQEKVGGYLHLYVGASRRPVDLAVTYRFRAHIKHAKTNFSGVFGSKSLVYITETLKASFSVRRVCDNFTLQLAVM